MALGDLFNLNIVNRFNYTSFHPFNEAKDHVIPTSDNQAGLVDSPNWDPLEARLSGPKGIDVVGQPVIHQHMFEPVTKYGPFAH